MNGISKQLLISLISFFFLGAVGGFGVAFYTNSQTAQESQGFSLVESFDKSESFFPVELFSHPALAYSDWSASVRGQVIVRTNNSFTLGALVFDENSKFKLASNGEDVEVRYLQGTTFFFEFPIPSATESIQGTFLEKREVEFSNINVGDILFGNVDFEKIDENDWQTTGRIFSINNHLKP